MGKSKYAKELIEQVILEYKNGTGKKALSVKYEIPLTTLSHWINNSTSKKVGRVPEDLKEKIIKEYESGLNTIELAKKYSLIENTVNSIIKRIARKRGVTNLIGNEQFFDVIDTERKAYYLGWLMADGNVSIHNNQYSIKIHINVDDRELIDNFVKDIDSKNSVIERKQNKNGKYYYSVYLSLTSRHMVESLMLLGVVPNKTGKEIIPNIDSSLKRHFIRGFFDGDGTIYTTSGYTKVGFISSEFMLMQIKEVLNWSSSVVNCHGTKVVRQLVSSKKVDVINLYNYMYEDATIFLKRKKDKFEEFLKVNTEVN